MIACFCFIRLSTSALDITVRSLHMMKFDLETLSAKQLITLIHMWQETAISRENRDFREMVSRCYESYPWHENAPIIHEYKPDGSGCTLHITCVNHVFSNMHESEEGQMMNLLRAKLLNP